MLWGGMCLSTTDSDCNGWEDLEGKKLFVPAKGSVPDIMTQYFLKELGNKTSDQVEIVYSNHVEIAQLIKSGKAHYAVDAQPFVTFNKNNIENYRVISDFVDAWKKTEGNEYAMPNFGIVVNDKFVNENQERIKTFNKELEKAIQWTVDNPSEAGDLAEKYLNANSGLIEQSMPSLNFVYKESSQAKKDIEQYCNVLSSFKSESIGGKMPDEEFYYKNE
jgi:NitT/TauT family transport system substrate-binding protein